MSPGLYMIFAVVSIVVRLAMYSSRQKDANDRAARQARSSDEDEDDYRELARAIKAKERAAEPDEEQGEVGSYRASAPRRPRRAPSTGPVVDVVVARCTRCDMRVSVGEEICASCARVLARPRRTK